MPSFRKIILGFVAVVCCTVGLNAFAARGVQGYWQTIDSNTNKPSSLIYIWKSKGKYFGKISKIYSENGHKKSDLCVKCKGVRHNKPMLGLTIIRNMIARRGKWNDGKILDPRNGKEYHAELWLTNAGQRLQVRGYIGIPLFGRTAVWYRYK